MIVKEQVDIVSLQDSTSEQYEGETMAKAQWSNKFQSTIALLGYSVGLPNLWRFPYVCQRNGGGAFLIPHMFFTIIVAIPLFFLEASLGQFSRQGPIGVWAMCPLMKGIGICIMTLSCNCIPYLSMLLAWALYYFYSSFSTVLPWTTCGNSWNTPQCVAVGDLRRGANVSADVGAISINRSASAVTDTYGEANVSHDHGLITVLGHTAAEEFWQNKVLGISSGLDDVGAVQLHLLVCWFLTCVLMFLCIMKGIRSIGKVVYVTTLMPYMLLPVLLVRACMQPGSMEGIMYYITPDFNRLQHSQVWLEGLLQVFFSVGPAWGTIITLTSHNSPHNNIVRDSFLIPLIAELTSVFSGFVVFATVGFLAHDLGRPVADVITSGPGIGFIVYPEAVSLLPASQLWSLLFFLVVLMMGIDSMFANIEATVACIEDIWPRRLHMKHLQTVLAAVFLGAVFLVGLPFTTSAGVYIFQLCDWYVGAVGCFVVGTMECLVVGWCYGIKRFDVDVEAMIGKRLPIVLKLLCFVIIPVFLLVAMGVTIVSYKPPSYGRYDYPHFAVIIGWCIAVSSVVPLPITMVIQILKKTGSLGQRIKSAMTPSRAWGGFRRRYGIDEKTDCTMKENARFIFKR